MLDFVPIAEENSFVHWVEDLFSTVFLNVSEDVIRVIWVSYSFHVLLDVCILIVINCFLNKFTLFIFNVNHFNASAQYFLLEYVVS